MADEVVTAEATPGEPGTGGSPDGAAPASSPPDSGAPPTPDPGAAATAPAIPLPVDDRVPWPKFREVQRGYTQAQRELEALRKEYEPTRTRVTELERQYQEAQKQATEYETLLGVFETRPDLRTAVLEALNAGTVPAVPRVPSPRMAPPSPALDPELAKGIRETVDYVRQAKAEAEAARKQAEQQQFNATVEREATSFLTARGFDAEKSLPNVLRYLAVEGAKYGDEAGVEHLPALLNRWYAETESLVQHKLKGYATGKTDAARTLPPTTVGGAPVTTTEKPAALGSPELRAQVMEFLRGQSGAA